MATRLPDCDEATDRPTAARRAGCCYIGGSEAQFPFAHMARGDCASLPPSLKQPEGPDRPARRGPPFLRRFQYWNSPPFFSSIGNGAIFQYWNSPPLFFQYWKRIKKAHQVKPGGLKTANPIQIT